MKKILFVSCLALGLLASVSVKAQQYSWAGTGNFTNTNAATGGAFPVFSTLVHTVVATAKDSFTHSLHNGYATGVGGADVSSITYTGDFYWIGGTPTVNVALYRSANYGTTYETTPVYTVNVSPVSSNSVVPVTILYLLNQAGGGGNPCTDYLWTATGSATSTVKWHMDGTIR